MSVYPSDGDIKFGWKSFGRSFALAGAAALAVAAVGYFFTHGHTASQLPASDQFLAFGALWIGGGLAILLAIAVYGSILISVSERGGVEVTGEGVRRIFKPGHEELFPREQIAGFVARPAGGVVLIGRDDKRQMIVPRSIEGYRDCIAELKAMGISSLPAERLKQGWANRKRTPSEWIVHILAWTSISLVTGVVRAWIGEHYKGQQHHWTGFATGLAVVVLILLGTLLEQGKIGKHRWGFWLLGAAAMTALFWRW